MAGKEIHLIVILGPTASGKTGLSLDLAQHIDVEIISADSRQVYKFMNIGTAKPDQKELKAVKHHFIDHLEPDDYFSAGKFSEEADYLIPQIIKRGNIPLIVGGSGLYIKALCEGLFKDNADRSQRKKVRNEINSKFELEGKEKLYDELMQVDPESAEKYNDMNPVRITRALEHYKVTGKKFSESILNDENKDYICHYYGIDFEREKLYDRINRRTELMWAEGLVEETKKLLEMGYDVSLNSMNTVGYKEVTAFLKGYYNKETAIDEMKKNTRRFAKRQLTWFRKNNEINWLKPEENMTSKILYDLDKFDFYK